MSDQPEQNNPQNPSKGNVIMPCSHCMAEMKTLLYAAYPWGYLKIDACENNHVDIESNFLQVKQQVKSAIKIAKH